MTQSAKDWISELSAPISQFLGQIFDYKLQSERIDKGAEGLNTKGNPDANVGVPADYSILIYGIFGMVALVLVIVLFKTFLSSSKKR